MTPSEFARHDATSLAALVRAGEVTPSELAATAITALVKVQPQLNTLAHPTFDLAEQQIAAGLPEGPFTGVPFLLKDTGATLAGTPMTSGSALFRGQVSRDDSTLVARYKAAGLVILGKTNTPELALSFTTEPTAQGVTRNPWNTAHSPGGSSGGSCAAVAAGAIPFAHASDGAGSIRLPASHCGLVGFKPSRMRTPAGPDNPEPIFGMSGIHAVTRSVRDSAALLDATHGPDLGDPYALPVPARSFLAETTRDPVRLRIGLTTHSPLGTPVDAACIAAAEEAARLLERLGHDVEVTDHAYDGPAMMAAWEVLVTTSASTAVRAFALQAGIADPWALLEPVNAAWLQAAARFTAVDLMNALGTLRRCGRALGGAFARYDVLLTPVAASPPPLLGALAGAGVEAEDFYARFCAHGPFTAIYNGTGCPAISVPFAQSAEGLPIGVHFGAALGADGLLFALAAQIERARPWNYRGAQVTA
jgi:amidase